MAEALPLSCIHCKREMMSAGAEHRTGRWRMRCHGCRARVTVGTRKLLWGPMPIPPELTFWNRVHKTDTCWIWVGGIGEFGHGYFGRNGPTKLAHRTAYEMCVGPIPAGLVLDHLCKNPSCVNPAHLEPVTQGENVRRADSRVGRKMQQTHCLKGHPLSGDNLKIVRSGARRPRRCCRVCQRGRSQNYQQRLRTQKEN